MKERNIPAYMADDYFCIAHPTTFRKFKNDFEAVHQYVDKGFQMIMNGEIGRYESVRFIEQTNVAKGTFTNAKSNWVFSSARTRWPRPSPAEAVYDSVE